MKKFLTTILAFLYLCTSTGASLQMHYCMGKLADWGVGHSQSKACDKCGMEKKDQGKGCCRDEQKFFKDNTDQQALSAGLQMLQVLASALPAFPVVLPTNYFPVITLENPVSHAPPPSQSIAVYIRNCVFLI